MCPLLFYSVSCNLLIFFFGFKHIWGEHTQIFHFEGIVFWLHDSFLYHRSMYELILKELFNYCFVMLKFCWLLSEVSVIYQFLLLFGLNLSMFGYFNDHALFLREFSLILKCFNLSFFIYPCKLKKYSNYPRFVFCN